MESGQYSKLTLTFAEDIALGERLVFSYGFGTVEETWVEQRSRPGEVSVGEPTEVPGERSAINFLQAIQLDYNGLFSFSQEGNQVVINAGYPDMEFEDMGITPPGVSFDSNNEPSINPFLITDISFSAAGSNTCAKIQVSVETNLLATKVISPVQIENNTDNPFTFIASRASGIVIKCEDSNGNPAKRSLILPGILSSDDISVSALAHPEGSTVTINMEDIIGLEYQYSLDDSTWQDSNVFSGLPEGDYTVYVRDQYGCKVSKGFHLDAFGINEPYFYISKSNSIQFAQRVDWGSCTNYKNDENTLSCEENVPLPYTEIQQFQTCDVIRVQFRTNFEFYTATVHPEGSEIVEVPIQRVSNNMRLRDRRDAFIYDLGGGKSGIYFTQGTRYDYVTGQPVGNYTLNGYLPEWGKIGNQVKINGAWFDIEDIIFNEEFNAEVLVTSAQVTAGTTEVEVASMYSLFNYEVFEATIDMGNYPNQKIKVSIAISDSNFGEINLESETIEIKERHKNTLEIRYKNNTNTDMFYATGIENKIRIPIERIDGKPSDETEVYKTDDSTILLNTEVHETNVFEFQPVTKPMMWKLVQALSHSDVLLDGVGYVKESIEVEGALEETNLYVVTATMIKSKGAFSESGEGLNLSESDVEIPGLVDFGGGFVRIG